MMFNPIVTAIVIVMFTLAMPPTAYSQRSKPSSNQNATDDAGLETFRLADRSNLRRLANGDFLFRLARETRTGVVYWAYLGTTRHVIATVPDWKILMDDGAARAILLRIADLPTRVGCGVGLIHQSTVYVVPEDAKYGESRYTPDVSPLYATGEVRNDVSRRTSKRLLSYRNFVASK